MGKSLDQVEEGIVIGNAPASSNNNLNKVIMGPSNNTQQNNHRVIKPKPVEKPADKATENEESSIPKREVVTIDQLFPEEAAEREEKLKKSSAETEEKIQDEIFEGENSPFMQAVTRKVQEMDEWMEEKREEQELEQAEKEFNDELDSYDDDASESTEESKEEEDEMTNEDMSNYDVDELELDASDDEVKEEEELDLDKDLQEESKEEFVIDAIKMDEDTPKTSGYAASEDVKEVESETTTASTKEETKKEEEKDESIVGADIDIEEKEEESEVKDDDEEDDDDEDEETTDDFSEEDRNNFKNEIIEKLQPSFKGVDISNFAVVKKANGKLNAHMSSIKSKVIKWVLYGSESCFFMKQFDGSDMENLREYLQSDNPSRELILQAYRIIYDHIVGSKPASFDSWMKSTPISDIPHYFFGVYVACFKDANYLPRDCGNDECKNHFISENIPIMDMVKFKNEAAKKKFMSIYNDEKQNVAANSGHYGSIRTAISDRVAVDLSESTIYRSIESGLIANDRKFLEKYANTIGICRFIDDLYEIDQENNQLIKISYKAFEGNPAKTFRSKIIRYSKVLSTLNSDEYRYLIGMIEKLNDTVHDDVTYRIPEIVCPKCGTTIDSVENAGAEFLVFFRSQLAALASRL